MALKLAKQEKIRLTRKFRNRQEMEGLLELSNGLDLKYVKSQAVLFKKMEAINLKEQGIIKYFVLLISDLITIFYKSIKRRP